MKTLGQRIRELRENRDLSLRELAQKLDLSPAFVSDVELGRRYPSEEVLVKMAKLLGVEIEDLKSYDPRAPLEELKEISAKDPAFAVALRKIKKLTAEELENLIKKVSDKDKKQ
jgi:transcriptional regulator with XRE-family HTH domain